MAWKEVIVHGEQIMIEANPAVDLSGGKIQGLFLCRVSGMTAFYVRKGATDGENVLVTARTAESAIAKVQVAIETGRMVRLGAIAPAEDRKTTPPQKLN